MSLQSLYVAVRCRLEVVSDHPLRDSDPAAHLAALRTAAVSIDKIVRDLPADCDPTLRHYLTRQSYTKALAWLEENAPGARASSSAS